MKIKPLTIDELFQLGALLTRYHYGLTDPAAINQTTAAHRYVMETTQSMLAIVIDECTALEDRL